MARAVAGNTATALSDFAAVDGQGAILWENEKEGQFTFDSGDFSALVGADPLQAVYVAPDTDPTGASGAWVRRREGDYLKPEWFGAARDGVTDDTPAFVALRTLAGALATGAASGLRRGPQIRLGYGTYYLASSFDCKGFTANWRGAGGGYDYWSNTGGSTIKMASGATWYFQAANTEGSGYGIVIPFSCAGSVFENITWQGAGKAVGSAILCHMRAAVHLMNCRFIEAGSHGLAITGTIGGGGSAEGNVNVWTMHGGACSLNGGSGMYLLGGDVNAGSAYGVSFNFNDRYGLEDESFLGSDWYGCHWNGNTLGHIHGTNPNCSSKYFGYWESGYPISTVPPRSMAAGTNAGNQVDGASFGANDATGSGKGIPALNGLQLYKAAGGKTFSGITGARPDTYPGEDWTYTDFCNGASALVRRFRPGTDIYVWELGLGSTNYLLSINGNGAGGLGRYTHGLGTAPTGAVGLSALYLGDGANPEGRRMVTGAAAPTTGEHARGEIVFNNAPSASGFAGWVCTTGGTPGTWKTFGAISA